MLWIWGMGLPTDLPDTTTRPVLPPLLSILSPVCLSEDEADLCAVTPLLVASYMLCYTPFFVSEVTLNTYTHKTTPAVSACTHR